MTEVRGTWVPDVGVSCIVLGDGSVWKEQCGGYSCLQKSAVGALETVGGEGIVDALMTHFCDKWCGWCDDGIDDDTAVFIEKLLPRFAVDRGALNDCCESWIVGFLDARPAILTWQNSD